MLAEAETTSPASSSPSDPQGEATSAMNTEPTSGETTALEPETTVANRRRGLWGWLLPSRRLLSDATEDQSTTSSTAPAEDTTAPAEDTTALAEDRATTTTTAADRATTSSTVLPEDQVEGQPSTTTTAEDQTALAQSETTALDASETTTTALPEDQAVGQTTAPAWSRFEGVCPGIRRPRRASAAPHPRFCVVYD